MYDIHIHMLISTAQIIHPLPNPRSRMQIQLCGSKPLIQYTFPITRLQIHRILKKKKKGGGLITESLQRLEQSSEMKGETLKRGRDRINVTSLMHNSISSELSISIEIKTKEKMAGYGHVFL